MQMTGNVAATKMPTSGATGVLAGLALYGLKRPGARAEGETTSVPQSITPTTA